MTRIIVAVSACVFSVALLAGCDSGPERFDVSGTITHDGEPIPAGAVHFLPDPSEGNSGPAGHATIKDGKFDTAESGQGTVGGPHTLTVMAYDGEAAPELDLPKGRPLFYDYSEKIDLPMEATSIEIAIPKQPAPSGSSSRESEVDEA